MQFTDLTFLFIFLPAFLLVYLLVPHKAKNPVLVVGSLLFFGWGVPAFLPVLLFLLLFNYLFGWLITRFRTDNGLKNGLFAAGLAGNLAVFVMFCLIMPLSGLSGTYLLSEPVGVLYFVLSGVSYLIDIYRRRSRLMRNFVSFAVYFAMFPRLLAGPVVCYHSFASQLEHHPVHQAGFYEGVETFVRGLAKKVLLADNIAGLTAVVSAANIHTLPVMTAWLGALGFAFQIYFDFAGYIDMARGLGKMLGFNLPINFRSPFSARSISDFFSRWNITLIHWLRTYTTPFLTRRSKGVDLLRILILCAGYLLFLGLKPGAAAAVVYILLLLMAEALFLQKWERKVKPIWRSLITFVLMLFAFVLVSQPTVVKGAAYILDMFGAGGSLFDGTSIYLFTTNLVALVLCLLCGNSTLRNQAHRLRRLHPHFYAAAKPACTLLLFLLSLCYLVVNPSSGFLCVNL